VVLDGSGQFQALSTLPLGKESIVPIGLAHMETQWQTETPAHVGNQTQSSSHFNELSCLTGRCVYNMSPYKSPSK
jgi:hypothetical protein